MCFFKDKWPKLIPYNEEEAEKVKAYLAETKGINNIGDLIEFIKPFTRKEDAKDNWQPAYKTYHLKIYDCEDMAIMIQEILHRCLGIENPWFVIYGGYFIKEGKRTYSEHAVCIFENKMYERYYEFTNKTYREAYNPLENNIMLYGYRHYPEGLKYYERRNIEGKIIDKKRAWIGYIK